MIFDSAEFSRRAMWRSQRLMGQTRWLLLRDGLIQIEDEAGYRSPRRQLSGIEPAVGFRFANAEQTRRSLPIAPVLGGLALGQIAQNLPLLGGRLPRGRQAKGEVDARSRI